MTMSPDLSEKTAVVTGAASGIGEAVAHELAAAGAAVVVADLDDSGTDVAAAIRDAGGDAVFAETDVSDPDAVAAMVETAREEFGGLDCAVNNAGIGGQQMSTAEYTTEAWNRVIGVNLTGVFFCVREELTAMLDGDGGSIVNVASILGKVGFEAAPAYTAAKHGVLGLTQTAAQEYATEGVRVNAVCPGFIETPMLAEAGMTEDEEMRAQIEAMHPAGRLGDPEEVASAVAWLCSGGSSFVTGAAYDVDGGYLSR
jgi:NAD(P)-dependent dehydrogenase (short-subunit alcohol dehydrogenase family)